MIEIATPAAQEVTTRRLELSLEEDPATARRREQHAFDELASPREKKLVLFGAGALGRRTLAGLRRAGIEPQAFCDNNRALWNRQVDGVTVLSPPDAVERFGSTCAFVVTIWRGEGLERMADRICQLTSLGCDKVIPAGFLFWKYAECFLPYYPLDLPHRLLLQKDQVREAYELFDDETSRAEYVAQVAFRLYLDYGAIGQMPADRNYFPAGDFRLHSDEVLIDNGAFDGDTILSFTADRGGQFRRIVAFEPDPQNWAKLQETLRRLPTEVRERVQALPYAIGDSTKTVYFDSTGTDLSKMGSGDVAVECVELDRVLAAETPTLMKFDIEGAELEALAGGRTVIRRHHPILAVSAYHQQTHLWEVPNAIHDMAPDYRFLLRPQGNEGWDLVCYAALEERICSQ